MKKILVVTIAFSLLIGCATMPKVGNVVLSNDAPTVVIISGAGNAKPLSALQKEIQGSVAIIPEKYYFLRWAAGAVLKQIREAGVRSRLILVGHSWGGLIAREIDAINPGLVTTVVTIATPTDIRFMPNIGDPFHPDDEESTTTLFVVAGIKPGAEKKWWMRSEQSDGVVDIETAIDLGKRNVKAVAVFTGDDAEHSAIVENPEVISQVQTWLNPGVEVASATK